MCGGAHGVCGGVEVWYVWCEGILIPVVQCNVGSGV